MVLESVFDYLMKRFKEPEDVVKCLAMGGKIVRVEYRNSNHKDLIIKITQAKVMLNDKTMKNVKEAIDEYQSRRSPS